MEQTELSCRNYVKTLWGTIWQYLLKLIICIPMTQQVQSSIVNRTEYKYTHPRPAFRTQQHPTQPECCPVEEQIHNLQRIHKMEYSTTIKILIFILPQAKTLHVAMFCVRHISQKKKKSDNAKPKKAETKEFNFRYIK